MIIIQDTREKIDKKSHIISKFQNLGINIARCKLFVGDYARADKQNVCVDVKKDWVEMSMDLCSKQHQRFRDECLRAKMAGIKLVILVEEEIPVEQWKSPLKRNKQPVTMVKGEILAKAINTMHEKYGVEFMNCAKSESADKILEILGVGK